VRPKKRADTRVCPYGGFDLSHWKALAYYLLESTLIEYALCHLIQGAP
jgi:hypothetical protein